MSRSSCTLLVLLSLALVAAPIDAAVLRGIIPVSGSTEGAFGSNFRTSLQLSNRTDRRQIGRLVFHPAGASASDADPSMPYALEPHQTIGYEDVVAAIGATGLGSIDLVVEEGGVPVVVTRAFDDKGDQGTTGKTCLQATRSGFESSKAARFSTAPLRTTRPTTPRFTLRSVTEISEGRNDDHAHARNLPDKHRDSRRRGASREGS